MAERPANAAPFKSPWAASVAAVTAPGAAQAGRSDDLAVIWGPQLDGADMRDGGCIIRQDRATQLFWDDALLKPYLDAWRLCRHELLGLPA